MMPPGARAAAALSRIRACRAASSVTASGSLRQRASGRERAEVRARRVEEHAVVALRRQRIGGVLGADLDAGGAHARGRAPERLGATGVAFDGRDGAVVADQ